MGTLYVKVLPEPENALGENGNGKV